MLYIIITKEKGDTKMKMTITEKRERYFSKMEKELKKVGLEFSSLSSDAKKLTEVGFIARSNQSVVAQMIADMNK